MMMMMIMMMISLRVKLFLLSLQLKSKVNPFPDGKPEEFQQAFPSHEFHQQQTPPSNHRCSGVHRFRVIHEPKLPGLDYRDDWRLGYAWWGRVFHAFATGDVFFVLFDGLHHVVDDAHRFNHFR